MGWLTCVVTTACSIPSASKYAAATQNHLNMKGFMFTLKFYTPRLVLWPFQIVWIGIKTFEFIPLTIP